MPAPHLSNSCQIKVFLIDDYRLILWGLERLVESARPSMILVGSATSCTEALKRLVTTFPDIILLDLDLEHGCGLNLISSLIIQSSAKILVLSRGCDRPLYEQAILAGARGVLDKTVDTDTILTAIGKVYAGEIWLDHVSTSKILVEFSRRSVGKSANPVQEKIATLTGKERKIVAAVAVQTGNTVKAIAATLFISESTMRNHLTSIYNKLAVTNRVELFVFAQQHGLTEMLD